mmetsp:Transcript_13865/g.15008  ORF Transcript_13865/g.15008 Transcript_13865/m.15008 type:complete len:433 (+) Transcript_13865:34-1332(+)
MADPTRIDTMKYLFCLLYLILHINLSKSVYGLVQEVLNGQTQNRANRNRCCHPTFPLQLHSSSSQFEEPTDEPSIQWELLKKHHVKGSWKGVWTTYDYIGDVIDETVASVDLNAKKNDDGEDIIEHTHTIVIGAKRSDCKTCFDSMEQRILPVSQYTPENILQKSRLAGCSMVNGPSLLRSGVMAIELILRHKDGRLRVIYQFAPVWERDVEPGSCPPQGLKLFRTTLSREAIRSTAPTAESEANEVPGDGNPIFYRPVPPFNWHKKWAGLSWTYGPQSGNRGWAVDELDETDSWHGITPVDCWNLRLPGGIHLQTPRIITEASVGICRLAWLPNDNNLLRVETGVSVLQPMMVEDDTMVGFQPPLLTSLRCDMLSRVGELENVPRPSIEWNKDDEEDDEETMPEETGTGTTPSKTIDDPASPVTPRDYLTL